MNGTKWQLIMGEYHTWYIMCVDVAKIFLFFKKANEIHVTQIMLLMSCV